MYIIYIYEKCETSIDQCKTLKQLKERKNFWHTALKHFTPKSLMKRKNIYIKSSFQAVL